MEEARPIIVAHRGLHIAYPENSLMAMRAAWEAGIAWAECDVHFSADGAAVVIHDNTLERTTTGRGRVVEYSAAELGRMRLLGADGLATKQTIPLLEEIWAAVPAGCRLLVETKPVLGERIVEIVRQVRAHSGMWQSFCVEDVELADRAMDHQLPCAVLAETALGLQTSIKRVHLNYVELDEVTVRAFHEGGIGVGAWTVDDSRDIRRVAGLGVDMLITDNPLEARRIVAEKPSPLPSPGVPGEGGSLPLE